MADLKEARVPDIGGFDDVPVIEVLVAVGDTVSVDQGLVTLESDKATMEVPASAAGVITELKVKVGDTVSAGDVIAIAEAAEEGAEMQTFGIDELPQTGEYGEIDSNGELRVAVVESQPAPTAGRPPASPLPRAPLAGLFENGPNGPLPIVAANSPSDCFRAAYEAIRIALTFSPPVILLSDGYLANGSEPVRTALEAFRAAQTDKVLAQPEYGRQ